MTEVKVVSQQQTLQPEPQQQQVKHKTKQETNEAKQQETKPENQLDPHTSQQDTNSPAVLPVSLLSPAAASHTTAMPRLTKNTANPMHEKSIFMTMDAMNQGEISQHLVVDTPPVLVDPEQSPVAPLHHQVAATATSSPAAATNPTNATTNATAPETDSHPNKSKALPNLVIAIPTMRRWTHDRQPAPEHYLRPLVQGIVESMKREHHDHVSFLLMNVDKEPEKHTELHELVASGIANFTVITKSKTQHIDMSEYLPKNAHGLFEDPIGREVSATTLNWRAGETMDAPRLLLQAHSFAPYVMFLEDDVTPTKDIIPKVYDRLRTLRDQGRDDFFMLDLYTPAIAWGPESIKSPRDLETYDYECCTQAMLFNSAWITDLAAYEFEHTDLPVDDNIREYVRGDPSAHPVYAVVPNLFEHVGAFSSNPEKSTGAVEHRSLNFEP